MTVLLAAYFLMAHEVLAQGTPPGGGTTVPEAAGKCKDFPGLTNKIAACVRLTLMDVSTMFFEGFYRLVRTAIGAFVTFVIAVYGVMTAMGMLEKPSRDTFALAIKISMVTYFVTQVDMIYRWNMDLMDAAGSAVVSFVPQSGPADANVDYSQITCLRLMRDEADLKPQEGNPIVGPWLAMDCVIDSVIGIKKEDANAVAQGGVRSWYNENLEGNGMARGLLRFFFSSFQGSTIGLLIAVLGFIFIYGLIFLIIKALFTYLGGYIGITFLLILAPLFIPLVLFRVTREYFDKWVKLVLSMTLQPIFILIFVTMSVTAMDLAMFSGDYSVMYKIAGDRSREQGFNLNRYLDEHQVVLREPRVMAEVKAEHDPQQCGPLERDPNAGPTPVLETFVNTALTQANGQQNERCRDYPLRFWHDSIDWEKLAQVRQPGVTAGGDATPAQQISREVLSAVIFAGIVIFVMNGLLAIIPSMANDIVGDFGVSPNLFGQMGVLPGQQQMSGVAQEFSGQIGERLLGRRGGGPQ